MSYNPTVWADRISGSPGQFTATGSVPGNVVLALNDNPAQVGTQVTAARMNNIETELVTLDTFMNNSPVPGSQTFNTSGTFTVPTGVTKIFIRAWAGGGGGAGAGGPEMAGGSGGSGGFICGWWMGVTAGQQIAVTIGAGGSAGSFSINGGAGGTTSIGAMSAYGGLGGILSNTGSLFSAGGTGGATSGNADAISKTGNTGLTGTTGSDLAGATALVGIDGGSAGAGGSANTSASSRQSGTAGGSGKVIINW